MCLRCVHADVARRLGSTGDAADLDCVAVDHADDADDGSITLGLDRCWMKHKESGEKKSPCGIAPHGFLR